MHCDSIPLCGTDDSDTKPQNDPMYRAMNPPAARTSAAALESSLILERSKPCPHERVLEAPGRGRPGEVPAQEMLALERLVHERGCKVPAPAVRDEHPAFACELLHVVGNVLADVEDVIERTSRDCGPRRLEALAQEIGEGRARD